MPIVIWELWEHEEPGDDCVCLSYFPSGAPAQNSLPSHARKVWSVDASSLIDAMTKRNQHLGWAPYQPMRDESGQPYPADLAPYEDT